MGSEREATSMGSDLALSPTGAGDRWGYEGKCSSFPVLSCKGSQSSLLFNSEQSCVGDPVCLLTSDLFTAQARFMGS